MALKRMDNVGIVVDDLTATIDFFLELGLELEGRATPPKLIQPSPTGRRCASPRGRVPQERPIGTRERCRWRRRGGRSYGTA